MTRSVTRTIEIDAPVEKVFAFMADPEASTRAVPNFHDVVVSDIETSPDGVVTAYKYKARIGHLPVAIPTETTVTEYVANQRIVEKDSTGVNTVLIEASGEGTMLTFTLESTIRNALLNKVAIFVVTNGQGTERWLDGFLTEVKKRTET
jgi:carbon monoxide dehydrogenase subunit G